MWGIHPGFAVHPLVKLLDDVVQQAKAAQYREAHTHTPQYIRTHPNSMEAEYARWAAQHPHPSKWDTMPLNSAFFAGPQYFANLLAGLAGHSRLRRHL